MNYKKLYEQLEVESGDDGFKVGQVSTELQSRFHKKVHSVLSAVVDTSTGLIHDAGCGFGDYAEHAGISSERYLGTDSRESAIARAKEKHPSHKFHVRDLETEICPEADIAVLIGAFACQKKAAVERIFENIAFNTKTAFVISCWGKFDGLEPSLAKEGEVIHRWLLKKASDSTFSNFLWVAPSKEGESIFIYYNE